MDDVIVIEEARPARRRRSRRERGGRSRDGDRARPGGRRVPLLGLHALEDAAEPGCPAPRRPRRALAACLGPPGLDDLPRGDAVSERHRPRPEPGGRGRSRDQGQRPARGTRAASRSRSTTAGPSRSRRATSSSRRARRRSCPRCRACRRPATGPIGRRPRPASSPPAWWCSAAGPSGWSSRRCTRGSTFPSLIVESATHPAARPPVVVEGGRRTSSTEEGVDIRLRGGAPNRCRAGRGPVSGPADGSTSRGPSAPWRSGAGRRPAGARDRGGRAPR